MTIASLTNKIIYVGDGATDIFAWPFKAIAESHLTITTVSSGTDTVLTNGTDYIVTGADADCTEAGGTVTLTGNYVNLASGIQLVIQRILPLTQSTDYVENDPFGAETHENALDQIVMQIQSLDERMDRSVAQDITWTGSTVTFPQPSASALIGWNSAATELENKEPIDSDTLTTTYSYAVVCVTQATDAASYAAIFVNGVIAQSTVHSNTLVPMWSGNNVNVLASGYSVGTGASMLLQMGAAGVLPSCSGAALTNVSYITIQHTKDAVYVAYTTAGATVASVSKSVTSGTNLFVTGSGYFIHSGNIMTTARIIYEATTGNSTKTTSTTAGTVEMPFALQDVITGHTTGTLTVTINAQSSVGAHSANAALSVIEIE